MAKAIPEGVLNPNGGSTDTCIQKVPADAQSLVFTADLMDATRHEQFGTIQIPLPRQPG